MINRLLVYILCSLLGKMYQVGTYYTYLHILAFLNGPIICNLDTQLIWFGYVTHQYQRIIPRWCRRIVRISDSYAGQAGRNRACKSAWKTIYFVRRWRVLLSEHLAFCFGYPRAFHPAVTCLPTMIQLHVYLNIIQNIVSTVTGGMKLTWLIDSNQQCLAAHGNQTQERKTQTFMTSLLVTHQSSTPHPIKPSEMVSFAHRRNNSNTPSHHDTISLCRPTIPYHANIGPKKQPWNNTYFEKKISQSTSQTSTFHSLSPIIQGFDTRICNSTVRNDGSKQVYWRPQGLYTEGWARWGIEGGLIWARLQGGRYKSVYNPRNPMTMTDEQIKSSVDQSRRGRSRTGRIVMITYSTTTSTSLCPIRSRTTSRTTIVHIDEIGSVACHFVFGV